MLSCKDISERAGDYLEHDLARTERVLFRVHLMLCGNCRRFMRQLRAMLGAFGIRAEPAPGEDFVERVATAIEEDRRRR